MSEFIMPSQSIELAARSVVAAPSAPAGRSRSASSPTAGRSVNSTPRMAARSSSTSSGRSSRTCLPMPRNSGTTRTASGAGGDQLAAAVGQVGLRPVPGRRSARGPSGSSAATRARHRFDRLAPARIARAVREQDDAESRWLHGYRLQHQPAERRQRHQRCRSAPAPPR